MASFIDALIEAESNNRNIYSTVDKDVSGPNTRSQGYLQINTPTWHEFAGRAGVDTSRYPNAMSAPRDVQIQVGSQIPVSRFGPRTQRLLKQEFGAFDTKQTVGALTKKFGGTLAKRGVSRSEALAYGEGDARAPSGDSKRVRAHQAALNEAGYKVPVHGKMDAATRVETKRFQAARGLPVTGEIDGATAGELRQPGYRTGVKGGYSPDIGAYERPADRARVARTPVPVPRVRPEHTPVPIPRERPSPPTATPTRTDWPHLPPPEVTPPVHVMPKFPFQDVPDIRDPRVIDPETGVPPAPPASPDLTRPDTVGGTLANIPESRKVKTTTVTDPTGGEGAVPGGTPESPRVVGPPLPEPSGGPPKKVGQREGDAPGRRTDTSPVPDASRSRAPLGFTEPDEFSPTKLGGVVRDPFHVLDPNKDQSRVPQGDTVGRRLGAIAAPVPEEYRKTEPPAMTSTGTSTGSEGGVTGDSATPTTGKPPGAPGARHDAADVPSSTEDKGMHVAGGSEQDRSGRTPTVNPLSEGYISAARKGAHEREVTGFGPALARVAASAEGMPMGMSGAAWRGASMANQEAAQARQEAAANAQAAAQTDANRRDAGFSGRSGAGGDAMAQSRDFGGSQFGFGDPSMAQASIGARLAQIAKQGGMQDPTTQIPTVSGFPG